MQKISAGALGLALLSGRAQGAADIAPADVWQALVAFNPTRTEHLIIQTLRIPPAAVAAAGPPAAVVTPALLREVFGVEGAVLPDPRSGVPLCIAYGLAHEKSVARI